MYSGIWTRNMCSYKRCAVTEGMLSLKPIHVQIAWTVTKRMTVIGPKIKPTWNPSCTCLACQSRSCKAIHDHVCMSFTNTDMHAWSCMGPLILYNFPELVTQKQVSTNQSQKNILFAKVLLRVSVATCSHLQGTNTFNSSLCGLSIVKGKTYKFM
jgi:hypothetical protein